jgi:hypothetical protein
MVEFLKHSGRRAFLKGAGGVALGLPLLEYTHGNAWAGGTGVTQRFLTVFTHGGTMSNMAGAGRHDGTGNEFGEDLWRPADPSSPDLVLGPIHEPLEPYRTKLNVVEGIDNRTAIQGDPYNSGAHGRANVTALTAAAVAPVGEDDVISLGPSIDHVVAQRLAARQPVPFDNVHLMISGHQYGTPYFSGPQQSVSSESSPLQAFLTLFDGVTGGEPDPAIVLRNLKRGSVLDGLAEGYDRFHTKVSATDRIQIEAHLEHIYALEQQILDPIVCNPPTGIDADGNAGGNVVGPLFAQLIVAALRCGLTNVINLQIADIVSPWTPSGNLEAGLDIGFSIGHSLHHMARDVGPTGPLAAKLADWRQYTLDNRRWRMQVIADILQGLDDPNFLEGDATLLDNSLLLCTSEFSNGSQHKSWNMPVLLAGSAGGVIETGRFITYNEDAASNPDTLSYTSEQSNHNLFTSILQAFGETDGHFGDDTAAYQGPLPGLVG